MLLSDCQKFAASMHRVAVADMTELGIDLFLEAANSIKTDAQLEHNFEFSRVQATLSVDGTTGGALSTATITGNINETLTVTSTAAAGTFLRQGQFGGYPMFTKEGATTYFMYYNAAAASYVIATTLTTAALTDFWLPASDILVPIGSYVGQGAATGTAVVTHATTAAWSGIREVIAAQRTNADGILVPLDFTRSDIPIERDRYELEMSEEYEPYRRYPSDAQLLQRGTNETLIQRGRTIYVYPVDAITTTPLSVTLEAYGTLPDYTSSSLLLSQPPDFLMEFGGTYMKWAITCALNYRFKTFTPRTEGNLSAPEKERDMAWRKLILWDTYQVDANATRSR